MNSVLPSRCAAIALSASAIFSGRVSAEDWPQFRGPGGQGISTAKGLPLTWSDTENIEWKITPPGPGASSPVVFGDRIYLTCYTGFGDGAGGSIEKLVRHLVCLKLTDGSLIWKTPVPAAQPEQEKIREDHGYASSTPVADADGIYAFFGRTGVFAFDHSGKQLWKADAGSGLNGWGSATSPALWKDLVIVNASIESESVLAFDRKTGKEIWRRGGIKESWHLPVVAENGGKPELIIAMIEKLKGLNPDTGEELWECRTGIAWYMCPSPVVHENTVYSIGGRSGGGLAVRLGGRGDVSSSHLLWQITKGSNVPSPVYHDGHIYFAHENLGVVNCVEAKTGRIIYSERLDPNPGQIYASPVLADGRLYYLGRGGRTVIVAAKPKFEVLGTAVLENNRGIFNASPAISGDRLLIRSGKALYCIRARKPAD